MDSRYIATKKVVAAGIVGNIGLFVIKIFSGIISNSQGMIADALNSGSDIFASIMAFIGNKIAKEPSDEDHNYGHGKAEYIFSMIISLSMILLAFSMLNNAISSIVNKETFIFSWWLVAVCIITIITKATLYTIAKVTGKKHDNILIEASAKDHINDVFVTSTTLIGIVSSQLGLYYLDGIVGIGISLWICYVGINIFLDSYRILMDVSISKKDKESIQNIAKNILGIDHIDNITSKPVGNKHIVVVKISVDGNMTVNNSHELASTLKYEALKLENIYDVIVHVNPI